MSISLVIAVGLTVPGLLALERLAPRIGLLDHPVGHSTHHMPTPVVGGLGMAIGLLAAWFLTPRSCLDITACAGAGLMLLLGCYDDRFNLRSRTKFLWQWLIVGLSFGISDTLIHSLGELSPIGRELRLAAPLAMLLTWFGAVGVVNAVNMLDGLDGLAGSVVLASIIWFIFAAWKIGDDGTLIPLLLLAAAIIMFLLFNLPLPGRSHARLFMGDAGALLLGFLLAWSAIHLSQQNDGIPPVLALWICALPVLDTLAVILKRRLRGRPTMQAGHDHLHHLLRARGLSVGQTVLLETSLAFLSGLIGVTMWQSGASDWQMLLAFLLGAGVYACLFLTGWRTIRRRAGRFLIPGAIQNHERAR